MELQQSVLRNGLAAAAVLIAAAFSVWNNVLLSSIALLIFVLGICYLALFIWIGEVARMMRAGFYIKKLEDRVNEKFRNKSAPLGWENFLRDTSGHDGTPQLFWNYVAIIGIFHLLALVSVVMGYVRIFNQLSSTSIAWIDTVEGLAFAIVLIYVLRTGQRFR